MKEKSTSDLQAELMSAPSIDSYIKKNESYFSDQSVARMLKEVYDTRDLTKAALARRAGISEVYLHQVFSGRRNPSRDRLICLCIGLETSLDEAQALLKGAGFATLYPKVKRDAIVIYGLLHHMELDVINEKFFVEGEKTLS